MDVTQEAADHAVRRVRRLVGLVLVVSIVTLFGAAAASAHPLISVSCSPAPEDCSGWYRSDVKVVWTVIAEHEGSPLTKVEGCGETKTVDTPELVSGETTFTAETAGASVTCAANDGGDEDVKHSVTIRIDKTRPVVTGGHPARGADANGWYTRPVAIGFTGNDLASGLESCTSLTYGGPDSEAASVHGTCVDRAGNVSAPFGFGLRYDATPPRLTALSATTGDRRVVLRWTATGGAEAIEVLRSPGLEGAAASVVVRGGGVRFADTRVRNGRRYTYEVRAVDAAGNVASRAVRAVPRRRLIAPGPGAIVDAAAPPLLRWTPVRGARYYNVQLFRDGRKVLSAWPGRARLQIKHAWSHGGTRVRFGPGTYRWHVWPGRGARAKADYGARIGIRKFVVP
jgi:hypothetical protein